MTWFPGNQRYFNQWINPLVTVALGRQLSKTVLVESATHPGVTRGIYYDVFTKSLDVRPRLQNFAPTGPQYNKTVVNVEKM